MKSCRDHSISPSPRAILLVLGVLLLSGCAKITALPGQIAELTGLESAPDAPQAEPPTTGWVPADAALGHPSQRSEESGGAADDKTAAQAQAAAKADAKSAGADAKPAAESKSASKGKPEGDAVAKAAAEPVPNGAPEQASAGTDGAASAPGTPPAGPESAVQDGPIFTFVLLGDTLTDIEGQGVERYRQLLWVIQAHALHAAGDGPAHTFVVPARLDREGRPLLDQTDLRLSAMSRAAIADDLRRSGRGVEALRLAERPGPFLLSSFEPTPIPVDAGNRGPRLLVDLTSLRPEYMYAVIDAYVPAFDSGTEEGISGLEAIQKRLLDLFPAGLDPADASKTSDASKGSKTLDASKSTDAPLLSGSGDDWVAFIAPPPPPPSNLGPSELPLGKPVVPQWQWAASPGCATSKGWRPCEPGR